MTKFRSCILGLAVVWGVSNASLLAQTEATTPATPTQTFYLTNSEATDATEIVTALRNILTGNTKIFLVVNQNAIVVQSSPDQLLLAQRVLNEVDRPKKTYRLTYTITEFDQGKRIGTQHFSMVVVSGQRTTLKQGSKVPVATGTYNTSGATSQTQFTYLDVGINIDATVNESPTGVRLRSKEEQSGIAESATIAQVEEPVIRQSVLEGTSIVSLGKPLILGSLDVPGSTRHLDIEAVVEVVK